MSQLPSGSKHTARVSRLRFLQRGAGRLALKKIEMQKDVSDKMILKLFLWTQRLNEYSINIKLLISTFVHKSFDWERRNVFFWQQNLGFPKHYQGFCSKRDKNLWIAEFFAEVGRFLK